MFHKSHNWSSGSEKIETMTYLEKLTCRVADVSECLFEYGLEKQIFPDLSPLRSALGNKLLEESI